MDKREYVNCIERALVGKVSPAELRDTVQYYRDYIDTEIRKGKWEQQVLEELGDPRLLAKTIAATHGNGASDLSGFDVESDTHTGKTKNWHIPIAVVIAVLLLLLMLVASLVLSVVRILLPIALPVLIIVWIVRLLKRNQ